MVVSERSNKRLVLVKTEIEWSITGEKKVKKIYYKNKNMIKKHMNKEKKKRQDEEKMKKRARHRTLMGNRRRRGATAQDLQRYNLLLEKRRRQEATKQALAKQESTKRKRGEKRCSACGMYGHTRTSTKCMYNVSKGRPQLGGKIKAIKFKKDQLKNLTSKGSLKLTLSKKKIAEANVEGRRMRRRKQLEEKRLYVFFFFFFPNVLSTYLSLTHTHKQTKHSDTTDPREELHLRNVQREETIREQPCETL